MKKHLKVLHVISQRPDSTGSGIYLQEILKASNQRGHENFLMAGVNKHKEAIPPGIKAENCHFIEFNPKKKSDMIIGMSDVMPYPSRRFQDLDLHTADQYLKRFIPPLSQIISDHNPDIIHSHHLWLLSSLIKKQYPNQPLVTSCHGSDLRQFNLCPLLRDEVLEGCRQISSVLSLSSEQKDEIIKTYGISPDTIRVTGAGYNPSVFFRDSAQDHPKRINILYAGKISRAKGVPWLLRSLIRCKDIKFHLHLVGSGSGLEYEECMEQALLLGSRISIHGMVSQQRLAELMRSSQVFILPSLHEGLPLVVLEALACGCTVITTNLPGARKIKNQFETNRLLLVDMPLILDTSSTLLANENRFVESLVLAIKQGIQISTKSSGDSGLSYFTWDAVFNRIEKCWLETFYKTNT